MRKLCATLLCIGCLALVGCSDAASSKGSTVGALSLCEIKYYGNGVYYFDASAAQFAQSLSKFIGDHPNLEVSTVSGDGTGFNGLDKGYFVTFREKAH